MAHGCSLTHSAESPFRGAFSAEAARFINVDLDGVLVDFYGATSKLLGASYKEVPPAVAWGRLEQVPHLFRGLPRLADALELWAGLQGQGALRILTAMPKPTGLLHTVPGDKRAWVREHISGTVPVVVVAHGLAKALWARPGDVLIDDLERNLVAWRAAGGVGILHRNARDTLAELRHLPLHADRCAG